MSKRHNTFNENYTNFFQIQEKLETSRSSNLAILEDHCFGDDINVTFISNNQRLGY